MLKQLSNPWRVCARGVATQVPHASSKPTHSAKIALQLVPRIAHSVNNFGFGFSWWHRTTDSVLHTSTHSTVSLTMWRRQTSSVLHFLPSECEMQNAISFYSRSDSNSAFFFPMTNPRRDATVLKSLCASVCKRMGIVCCCRWAFSRTRHDNLFIRRARARPVAIWFHAA